MSMQIHEKQVDWRWGYVQELVASAKRFPQSKADDKSLKDCYSFFRALKKAQRDDFPIHAFEKLQKDFKDMAAAHSLFAEPNLERFFVEAMVMADTPRKEISEKTGYSPKAIKLFEEVFFDVRHRLDRDIYVKGVILGPLFNQTSEAYTDHFWKAIGYFYGQEALDSLWNMGNGSAEAQKKLVAVLRNSLLSQAAYASFARKPGTSNAGFIIESYLNHEHLQIAKDTSTANIDLVKDITDPVTQLQSNVLKYMSLSVKKPDEEHATAERQLADDVTSEPAIDKEAFEKPDGF